MASVRTELAASARHIQVQLERGMVPSDILVVRRIEERDVAKDVLQKLHQLRDHVHDPNRQAS